MAATAARINSDKARISFMRISFINYRLIIFIYYSISLCFSMQKINRLIRFMDRVFRDPGPGQAFRRDPL